MKLDIHNKLQHTQMKHIFEILEFKENKIAKILNNWEICKEIMRTQITDKKELKELIKSLKVG